MNKCLSWEDIKSEEYAIKVHEHGFVYLKSVYGDDFDIANAARISYGKGTKTVNDDESLIRYLVRNRHTSPLEQACATFIIKLPIFVMRQLIRHRTAKLNEYSGRYSVMPEEYYVPLKIRSQSTSNKQGSDGTLESGSSNNWMNRYHNLLDSCTRLYQDGINMGMAKELARICLPVSQYTICIWQMDLHNLMNFLRLRLDKHAQQEIVDYADPIYKLLREHFPATIKAFEDYILNSMTFSASEIRLLKKYFQNSVPRIHIDSDKDNMSQREINEFLEKMNILCDIK